MTCSGSGRCAWRPGRRMACPGDSSPRRVPLPSPQQIIEDPLMRHSAILVFANKQDLVRCKVGCASGVGGACRLRPLRMRRAVSCCARGRRFVLYGERFERSSAHQWQAHPPTFTTTQLNPAAWRADPGRDVRGDGPARFERPEVARPGRHLHQGRGSLRGPRLAVQHPQVHAGMIVFLRISVPHE